MPLLSPKTLAATIAAAIAALAATAGPAAAARPHVTLMKLAVQMSATHTVRWHIQDPGYPDPAKSWVLGDGTQTLTFADPQPVTYIASHATGTAPDGTPLTPLAMTPARWPGPLHATVTRTATWTPHDAEGCDREGGCGDADLIVPLHQQQNCPARTVDVTPSIDVDTVPGSTRWRLMVLTEPLALDGLWTSCPPDIDGVTRPLAAAQPENLAFADAINRIAHLRPGQTVSLRAGRRTGVDATGNVTNHCPTLTGAGHQECATTRVTLNVRRLR